MFISFYLAAGSATEEERELYGLLRRRLERMRMVCTYDWLRDYGRVSLEVAGQLELMGV